MITRLTGRLLEKLPTSVIIDINGIGFEVLISSKTFEKLPEVENSVTLVTYTYLREDEIKLIGFLNSEDKDFFTKLISVSGISIKIALSSLSIYSTNELKKIILKKEIDLIRRIPGIGKKLAERLIVEIYDKIKDEELPIPLVVSIENTKIAEVREALKTLGYTNTEINEVLKKIKAEDLLELKIEEILKAALKEI